ncbi:MAG: hypothetical protein ACJ72W_20515 [Actinoallomurus sp.]
MARLQTPLSADSRIGTVVDNRVFTVRVDRVDVASGIRKEDVLSGDRRMATPGIDGRRTAEEWGGIPPI